VPTLGETLKEQRETLGLSIEQAEEATRIRGRLLEMLENDDYDHLPDPGYVKGYVASYAKYLELDPIEMVDRYRTQIGSLHVHEINVGAEPLDLPTTREQHAIPWKIAVVAVVVLAVLALAVWGVSSLFRGQPQDIPDLPAETTAPAEAQPKKEATAPSTTTTKTAAPKPVPFALVVAVEDGSRSWLRITVDGKVDYEGVLEGGNQKEYKVAKEAKLRIGAPGGVTVTRDGQPVTIPDGEIPSITLKASAPK